ncbi:MAG: ribonuclease III [Deltaproteobacteria bacterium]|nr:ribonuclease III [Deltaproteobacteria bacterium]
MNDIALETLEERLGHRFADRDLLLCAITHTSYANEHDAESNERLEFLGDAILQACMTISLFRRFPDATEGEMSQFRARLVNAESLAGLGAELELGPSLRLGRGEAQSGGRTKPTLLENASEAVLGALYLDAGFEPCFAVVSRLMESRLDTLDQVAKAEGASAWKDPRSRLQEETQRQHQQTPTYGGVSTGGPPHEPTFEVEARVEGKVLGRGAGGSKREAMRMAAVDALERMEKDP